MKRLLLVFLFFYSNSALAQWIQYAKKTNGDVFFYDSARVEITGDEITVWTRVRYKASVMAAQSYQNVLLLDCSTNSETELQSTFFSDKEWTKPAMATNTNAKPKKPVKENSTSQHLINILCTD